MNATPAIERHPHERTRIWNQGESKGDTWAFSCLCGFTDGGYIIEWYAEDGHAEHALEEEAKSERETARRAESNQLGFPAATGESVEDAHAEHCREYGHAFWVVNGTPRAKCARCGAKVAKTARNRPEPGSADIETHKSIYGGDICVSVGTVAVGAYHRAGVGFDLLDENFRRFGTADSADQAVARLVADHLVS